MTTDTLTLTAFLLARIEEDEAVAKAAAEQNGPVWIADLLGYLDCWTIHGTLTPSNPKAWDGDTNLWDDEGAIGMYEQTAKHIVANGPARVLAECAAKRAIVDGHSDYHVCPNFTDQGATDYVGAEDEAGMEPCPTLRALAAVCADHPDFNPVWA